MSQPKIVLVIGASRGIGRALVQEFAKEPNTEVIASVRNQADADFDLPNVSSVILDLSKADSVTKAAEQVQEIDILIVNAGMGVAEPVLDLTEASFQKYFDINVTGPWRVVQAFIPALKARKTRKIIFTSSMSGSIQLNYDGKVSVRGAYAITKAAVNMFAQQLHLDLAESDGFIVVPMHPGWVDTALGNPDGKSGAGALKPAESASGIVKVAQGLQKDDSGRFFQWDGKNLPW